MCERGEVEVQCHGRWKNEIDMSNECQAGTGSSRWTSHLTCLLPASCPTAPHPAGPIPPSVITMQARRPGGGTGIDAHCSAVFLYHIMCLMRWIDTVHHGVCASTLIRCIYTHGHKNKQKSKREKSLHFIQCHAQVKNIAISSNIFN
jgi:hypothetical protein